MPLTYMHWQWDRVGERDRPKWPLTILCSPSQFWFGHTHKYHLDWLLFVNILACFFRPLILCVFLHIKYTMDRMSVGRIRVWVFLSLVRQFLTGHKVQPYRSLFHFKSIALQMAFNKSTNSVRWNFLSSNPHTHTHYSNKNEMYSEHIAWISTRKRERKRKFECGVVKVTHRASKCAIKNILFELV